MPELSGIDWKSILKSQDTGGSKDYLQRVKPEAVKATIEYLDSFKDRIYAVADSNEQVSLSPSGKLPSSLRPEAVRIGLSGSQTQLPKVQTREISAQTDTKAFPPLTVLVLVDVYDILALNQSVLKILKTNLHLISQFSSKEYLEKLYPEAKFPDVNVRIEIVHRTPDGGKSDLIEITNGNTENLENKLKQIADHIVENPGEPGNIPGTWEMVRDDAFQRFRENKKAIEANGELTLPYLVSAWNLNWADFQDQKRFHANLASSMENLPEDFIYLSAQGGKDPVFRAKLENPKAAVKQA